MRRPSEDVNRRAFLDEHAVREHDHTVGMRPSEIDVVGGDE
jgi:hypothetical protein